MRMSSSKQQCLFQNNNHKTTHKNDTNCGSAFEPGGSGLPYYCAPPLCVLAVLGALAVWRLSTKKKILRNNLL